MKKSNNNDKQTAINDTSEQSSHDDCGFSFDKQYCEYCEGTPIQECSGYKCWIK